MKITIVVDANPIISALIGGVSREVLFDERFNFITTETVINEVKKYIPLIAEKSNRSENYIRFTLSLLPIKAIPKDFYKESIKKAKPLIEERDKKDVEILALTLAAGVPLWSQDKDFENIDEIVLLKTKDILV